MDPRFCMILGRHLASIAKRRLVYRVAFGTFLRTEDNISKIVTNKPTKRLLIIRICYLLFTQHTKMVWITTDDKVKPMNNFQCMYFYRVAWFLRLIHSSTPQKWKNVREQEKIKHNKYVVRSFCPNDLIFHRVFTPLRECRRNKKNNAHIYSFFKTISGRIKCKPLKEFSPVWQCQPWQLLPMASVKKQRTFLFPRHRCCRRR